MERKETGKLRWRVLCGGVGFSGWFRGGVGVGGLVGRGRVGDGVLVRGVLLGVRYNFCELGQDRG